MDLKELWGKQAGSIPDTSDLIQKAREFKRKSLWRLVLTNILLLVTSAFIVLIWIYFQPEMITTKLGIALIILAMLLYLLVYNKLFSILGHVDYEASNSECLQRLLKLKEKQLFLHTTMLNTYFILLFAGICLYMFEYVSRMTVTWGAFSYGITLLWVALNWFYFRPRSITKQQDKINKLIRDFEGLHKQLMNQ
jgi:hypothetical protein